jgi:hypothetical protein
MFHFNKQCIKNNKHKKTLTYTTGTTMLYKICHSLRKYMALYTYKIIIYSTQ